MNTNITKRQHCILTRAGVQIWIDEEQSIKIGQVLDLITEHKFITIGGRRINTADLSGVFLPEDIENMNRMKNGQWQCMQGTWHDKNQKCQCIDEQAKNTKEHKKNEFYKRHGYYPPE